MRNGIVLLGLLCWPAAVILHQINDHDTPKPEPEVLYQFEVVDRGDVYIVDYGLTLEDCQKLKGGTCRAVRHGHPRRP